MTASSLVVDPEKEAWNLLRAVVVNYCGSLIAGTQIFFNFSMLNLAASGSRCGPHEKSLNRKEGHIRYLVLLL